MADLFSELNGPDGPPESIDDDFYGLAGAAMFGSSLMLADLMRDERKPVQHVTERLQVEIARYMRKVYVWGQTGVHPRDQAAVTGAR